MIMFFLLSFKEMDKYLKDNEIRKYHPPVFPFPMQNAVNPAFIDQYWLRTIGVSYVCATYVSRYGTIEQYGAVTGESPIGVRPAIWVNLDENIINSIQYE